MKKRWEIDRRHFLRGSGLLVGLPLLDAMLPSIARAACSEQVAKRLIFCFNPNGIVPLGPEIDYGAPHDRGRFGG